MILLVGALVVVGVIALVVMDALITKPTVAAALVVTMAMFITAFGEVGRIPIGGQPVSVPDGIFIMVSLAGVARLLRIRRSTTVHLLLVLIWVLLIVSLVLGVSEYGAQAGRELRPFMRFFGPALYFSTITPDRELLDRIGVVWLRGMGVLLVLILLRLIAVGTGLDLGPIASRHPSASFALRVIPGYQSFTVGQAFVLLLPAYVLRPDGKYLRALTILLGAAMLILNRRTVYVAVLVGLAVMLARSRTLRRGVAPVLAGVVITVGVGATLFSSYLPEMAADEDPVAQSPVDSGTLMARIEGWEFLLAEGPRGTDWLIGTPLGPGFDRIQNGNEVGWNPHSYYVLLLLRIGFVGVIAFFSLYALAIRRLWVEPSGDELFSPATLLVLLVMQLVFFTTWIAPIEQGVLLGVACAFCDPLRGGQVSPRRTLADPVVSLPDRSHARMPSHLDRDLRGRSIAEERTTGARSDAGS